MIKPVTIKAVICCSALSLLFALGFAGTAGANHKGHKLQDILSIKTKSPSNVLISLSSVQEKKDRLVIQGELNLRRPGPMERLNGYLELKITKGRGVIYQKREAYMQPQLNYGKLSTPQFMGRYFEYAIPLSLLINPKKIKILITYNN